MKNAVFFIIYIFLLFCSFLSSGQNVLSGYVTDKETGEALQGATVFLPDLKTGTSTDKNGTYKLGNLPGSHIVVQVSFIGYKAEVVILDLTITHTRDFQLIPSPIEVKEVVVTGNAVSSDNDRGSISITPINKDHLLTIPSTNLINSISMVPGVSEITTGGEISWDNKYLNMSLNGFYNTIDNFIYYRNINGEKKEVGIYNMGRRITFGLVIPFGIYRNERD